MSDTPHILLSSDHAGFALKEVLIKHLEQEKISYLDMGPFSTASVDYPDSANKLCHELVKLNSSAEAKKTVQIFGVLICGSGQGMAMTANRIKGIRAALCWDTVTAQLSRQHNNANILCIGGRLIPYTLAEEILWTFLKTPFQEGRHVGRIQKIDNP